MTDDIGNKMKKVEEDYWAGRSELLVEQYWNWKTGNVRSDWFSKKISNLKFDSIFEVGVFGGRNLKYVKYLRPDVKIGGLDINKPGVDYAQKKFPEGKFYNMSAFDIDVVEEKWDIIFTIGVMIHLAPQLLKDFVDKMIKKTNKYIIHLEQTGTELVINGPAELKPVKKKLDKIRHIPNLIKLYRDLGYKVENETLPLGVKTSDCTNYILIDVGEKNG